MQEVVIYIRLLFTTTYSPISQHKYTNTILNAHAPVCPLSPKPTDTHTQIPLFL